MTRRAGERFAPAALAVALATILVALLLLALQGLAPGEVLGGLADGAFGSARAWTATLRVAAPLLLCTVGVTLSFRAGLWNIGAEGQLIAGGLAAAWAAGACGHWLPALAAGTAAGALWAFIPGWAAVMRGVPVVLTSLMLNGVAFELLRWLVTGPLQEPTRQYPQTEAIPAAAWLPALGGGEGARVVAASAVAVAIAAAAALFLHRTRAGLRLRAGAQCPKLLAASGWPLRAARATVFAIAGGCAGLAGAVEVCGGAGLADRSLAQGLGYAAVAAALLSGLRPLLALPAALLFAALASGTAALQWSADLPGIDRFGLVLQGLVVLALLVALRLRARRAEAGA